jgi:type II secretory pathway pseudopilin PulG
MLKPKPKLKRARGFFLVEIALAIILLGIIAAAVFPLLNLASRKESDNTDRTALVQARESLLAYATRNGGFPGPLQLANVSGALSRTAMADPMLPIEPDAATYTPYGALPGSLLGTPTRSSKGTLFNYDVHPALRADLSFNFSDFLYPSGVLATTVGFKDLHSPTRRSQGTGGTVGQLCRNVNTLIELERLLTVNNASLTTSLRSMTLPRVWQSGVDSFFSWTGGRFSPLLDGTVTSSWTQQRSSPSAFVVTRPHAQAYARLDRANAVFVDDVPAAGAYSSYRVYEHPTTGSQDSAVDDVRDYGGWSNAASLLELRAALQTAGQCTRPVDNCLNTELLVIFDNALTGQYYAPAGESAVAVGTPIGLPLYWVVNTSATAAVTGSAVQPAGTLSATVASNTNATACVPVVPKDWAAVTAFVAPLYLHLYALLPDGKYWEVALPKQMMNTTDSGVATMTALNSGQSHAVTVKCFNGTPIRFEPDASAYTVPDPTLNVACTATQN